MLYTIGYEGMDTQKFVSALKSEGIKVLVDVREMPLSRKKGFSKSSLAALMESEGIEYRHIRTLGAPKAVRYRLREGGEWAEYCEGYQTHLADCEEALSEVVQLANQRDVCLMCFEADYRECHRSLIAEHLKAQGQVSDVIHLSPQKDSASRGRMTA